VPVIEAVAKTMIGNNGSSRILEISTLFDENRCVKRIVTLNVTRRRQGNDMQDKQLENCCPFKGLGDWNFSAAAADIWMQHALEFVAFVNS
jgi:hypothetical protein